VAPGQLRIECADFAPEAGHAVTYQRLPSEEGAASKVGRLLPQSQGQNLALTVLYVPHSLESDGRKRGARTRVGSAILQVCNT